MTKTNVRLAGATALGIAALIATMGAQVNRGTTEWLTAGGDAQRTFWIRTDPRISVAAVSQPGFDLQWSATLDSRVRGVTGLGQGVSANGVTLFIPMTIIGGSANNVYALDNDTGYVVWQRRLEGTPPSATAQCPGGTVATTRIVPLVPPTPIAGAAGGGATQAYRSAVGQPGEGVPVEVRGGGAGRAAAPAGGAPAAAGAGRGPAGPPGTAPAPAGAAPARAGGPFIPGATPEQLGGVAGLARPSGVAYAVSSDGALHVLGLPSGKDIQRPTEFLPANARWSDTIAVNTTLYATTTGNCGSAPNAIWATDLESDAKPVVSWKTNGGPMVGRVAFGMNGTLYASVGPGRTTGDGKSNAIVALDPKTLQVKDWFTQTSAEFVTGPMVFTENGAELVAAATKDGRILVLNTTALGGADHATPHASAVLDAASGAIAVDALSTWQDTSGTRWILAATTNGMAALKLSSAGGRPTLERGWTAQNLAAPATPVIVNGVVFVLATGRPSASAGRAAPAVLHAYEGASGRELWTSGKAMTASASAGSFWSAFSQVYVGTSDGRLHAFGLRDERR
jgi:outer membrane protein assembly factor BamB